MKERDLHVDELMDLLSREELLSSTQAYDEGLIKNRSISHFFTFEGRTYPSRSLAGYVLKNKGINRSFTVDTVHLVMKKYGIDCWVTHDINDPRLTGVFCEEEAFDTEEAEIAESFKKTVETVKNNVPSELKIINEELARKPVKERTVMAKVLSRNRVFAQYVKQRAGYRCEICGCEGFETPNGLYAEAHHIYELAKTKIDLPSEMICVCPTCHRVIHYGTPDALEARYKLNPDNSGLTKR